VAWKKKSQIKETRLPGDIHCTKYYFGFQSFIIIAESASIILSTILAFECWGNTSVEGWGSLPLAFYSSW
jgi:hypothetical protein